MEHDDEHWQSILPVFFNLRTGSPCSEVEQHAVQHDSIMLDSMLEQALVLLEQWRWAALIGVTHPTPAQ